MNIIVVGSGGIAAGFSQMLRKLKHEVRRVSNVAELSKQLQTFSPHAFLIDKETIDQERTLISQIRLRYRAHLIVVYGVLEREAASQNWLRSYRPDRFLVLTDIDQAALAEVFGRGQS